MPTPIATDVLVIGAGPVGLFQAFQLGLQDIRCHIVDSLPHPGGQCTELYGDKPIYDIPGLPRCTGKELIERLQTQVKPFAPLFHGGHSVSHVAPQANGFAVATAQGLHFQAHSVVIAAGVGAFEPRRLAPEAFKALHDQQVFFAGQDPSVFAGQACLVVGGDATAIEAALQLRDLSGPGAPTPVGLMHRRDVWDAEPALIERMRQCVAQGQMQLLIGQPLGPQLQDGRMKAMDWVNSAGETQTLACDAVWVQLGLSPQLGALAQWGLAMQRKQLAVDSATFATSVPGIFAVGDINTYPGKQKLILCGFHEATLAAFAIAARLRPGERTTLQYTTTSTHLHRLLGVDGR